MSVYKPKGSPFYHFDFKIEGHRFHGSTKETAKRAAQEVEKAERQRAKREVQQQKDARTSLKFDHVAGRYMIEVGQFHIQAHTTHKHIEMLIQHFGPDTLITDIDDNAITALIAWRRGHRVNGRLIQPATVNATTKQLRKLFNRCKLWGVRFDREPYWRAHWLEEPQERVRELVGDEGDRLHTAARSDYADFFRFVHLSGLRLNECVTLKWSEVDWQTRRISKPGKGGRRVVAPITSEIRSLLWPLRGHHPEAVFTYVVRQPRRGQVQKRGERAPITYEGVRSEWRQLRQRSGVTDFRLHDLRHDYASKLLRDTGNLKLVSKALNHASIRTTVKYAHVDDTDVFEALESRSQSRTKLREIS